MKRYVPSPAEAQKRLGRVFRFLNLVFEVQLGDGVWRSVRVGRHMPVRNLANPDLSMLAFTLDPWIATPFLPEIRGVFFASQPGYERGIVSWVPAADMAHLSGIPQGRSVLVPFRAANPDAEAWFVLQLAEVRGMRFRNRQLIRQDRYEYRREP